MGNSIKIQSALACDDVRHEMGNRWTLVGVCGLEFQVSNFPARMRLHFVVVAELPGAGKFDFAFRLIGPDGSVIWKSDGSVEAFKAAKGALLPIGVSSFELKSPGDFALEQESPPGRWRVIQVWSVVSS